MTSQEQDKNETPTEVDAELTKRIREQVEELLEEHINPNVASHGGVISLVDVQGTRIFLHMGGGCQGCGMATQTLRHGVEGIIRENVPEVTEILDSTDHGAGTNPFFQG